ncbi:hypothetical protein BLNAU_13823 [Blattamonas nauphoetae]|uniref:Uncharacterized protein n=1 Tax=Blattamonas nauphoetae TaxID=2049346 RepID=A0ABQ9XKS9_9EUKA|nr:hypothetical protein BLNAU_13823 [Blattamonas nauphoetae]
MKERSEIGIRSGLLERFSERLSSNCPSSLSAILSSVIGVMVTSVSEGRPRLRSDLIPSLLTLSSHADISLSTPATHSLGLLCGGSLSSMEVEGVLNSGIIETLCTRIESESNAVDLLPTLHVLDRLCSGLQSHHDNEQLSESKEDQFSLTRRCEFALSRIEKAVLGLEKSVGGKIVCDDKARILQDRVGGMIVRHFQSSIHSSQKEIGVIGIDLAAVRREMEAERTILHQEREAERREMEAELETVRKVEEERQREFSRKMREMEEMKRMNEKWIEEGRQREEEKKREEEERRRSVKEGAASIEVFQDKFTLAGKVFTKSENSCSSIFTISFGQVVVRITFIVRSWNRNTFDVGLIAADMVEQATSSVGSYSNLKRAASWHLYPSRRFARQNNKDSHKGSACQAVADGQRVVLEADGRERKRTLKLSQDGETQPAFFSNIPVPFRFGIEMYNAGASVEIVSSEVLKEPSMVGGSLEVVMD